MLLVDEFSVCSMALMLKRSKLYNLGFRNVKVKINKYIIIYGFTNLEIVVRKTHHWWSVLTFNNFEVMEKNI